jgi:hypothetical protein
MGFLANRHRVCFALLVVVLGLVLIVTSYDAQDASTAALISQALRSQAQNLLTLDYENEISKPKTKEQKEKNKRFNGRGSPNAKPITELPDGIEPLPIVGHWWIGLSPLPIDQSDAVVIGVVGGSEAHLSEDRTGIYSEYSFLVSEVLKDSSKAIVAGPLTVNRIGGAVRFKSGKVQRYEISGQGILQTGAQYVLFLRKSPAGDLLILTGYELSNDRVSPVDGVQDKDPRKALPFSKYRDAEQSAFLKELREAARSTSGERIQP